MKKKSFFFHFSLYFLLTDLDMNTDYQQDSNLWKEICNTEKKEKTLDMFNIWILPYQSTSVISGELEMGYRISQWIGKFLGRAGFEPAQTYCQRIYSPSPLTARASTQHNRKNTFQFLLKILDQLPFVTPYPQGKSNPRCLLEREMS